MDERRGPLATTIDEAVSAFGCAVRREVRRTMLGLLAGLVSVALVVVVGLALAVVGVMRLGDALGRICGQWFGDQALGDVTVGLALLTVPIVGVLWMRLRSRW